MFDRSPWVPIGFRFAIWQTIVLASLPLLGCGGEKHVYSPPNPNPPEQSAPGAKPPWGGQQPIDGPAPEVPLEGPPTTPAPIPVDGAEAGAPPNGRPSFFVTSKGNGQKGGNFGGVAGADAFCRGLASSAGLTGSWVAYVSTASENARDRIGPGPWYDARGMLVASSVAALHQSGLRAGVALDEKGKLIDMKNAHDVITGSNQEGRFGGDNCRDYRSAAPTDRAWVGHADGKGVGQERPESWNAAHATQGCDAGQLQKTASQSHLYCFAKQ